ncbi:YfhO family protein [Butyrivibrio fibrisolvens]|uniref:YfhO family protein n=1 Tax=Butyrivibrio fibrisolvens TaxID=831 RepID=UPI0009B779A5|nr:YfhO family protein [Butyrivibrio fibrisolvens]
MNSKKSLLSNPIILYSILFIIITTLCTIPFVRLHILPIWNADSVGQYYPAFLYIGRYLRSLIDSLLHGSCTIPTYDLKIGMGENIIGCLNYYGFGDPVNLIAILANKDNGYIVFIIVYIIRVYLSGISSLLYAKEMNFNPKVSAIGAVAYSFCGFSIYGGLMYIEWLSVMFYFPLMIAGAEAIIKDQKNKAPLLILSVLYGALCGFYYLYMSSLALAGYCIIRVVFRNGFSKIRQSLNSIILLLALYISGIALASPFLIPAIQAFLNSERNGNIINTLTTISLYVPNYSMIRDFFKCSIGVTKTYAMGIGIAEWLVIALSIFMPNSRKNMQIKVSILVTLLAISIPMTYWLFNGFGESNSRWYYIVHFLVMVVFVSTLTDINAMIQGANCTPKIISKVGIYLVCLLTCANVVRDAWGLILPYGQNWGSEFITTDEINIYADSPVAHSEIIMNDPELFRVDTETFLYTIGRPENVAMINNYNGCTYWFSIVNKYTQTYATQSLGMDFEWRSFGFNGRIYTQAMSGCKYYVSKSKDLTDTYELAESITFDQDIWYVYRNPFYTGFAYMIDTDSKEYDDSTFSSLEDYNRVIYKGINDEAVNTITYDYTKSCFRCTTTKAGRLVVVIPYDTHWKAYIDGEKVQIDKFNAYLSIEVAEGQHDIRIVY